MGCQDKFGNNMRPVGGVLGGMCAFGGGTEHQGYGTPHLHGQGHLVCAYQFNTLEEIAQNLWVGGLSLGSLKVHKDWLHREDVLDEEIHAAFLPRVEKE